VLGLASIAIGPVYTTRDEGNAMDEQVEAYAEAHAATAEAEAEAEAAEAPAKLPAAVARAMSAADRHKLVADISVFHYKRLRMVASERGIPVGVLVEELIDRMWTYRSG